MPEDIVIDEVVRTKRRTLVLTVTPEAKLVVRASLKMPEKKIKAFVHEKRDWILRKQARARTQQVHMKPKQFVDGETFLYLGQAYTLSLCDDQQEPLICDDGFILARRYHARARVLFTEWYKRQARTILTTRITALAQELDYHYASLRIGSARKRLGSCSARGKITLSWRLIHMPRWIIDYVIVHELVHLEVHNHSSRFWHHVAVIMPAYKKARRWIKDNAYILGVL